MKKEELKTKVEEILLNMGCTSISFAEEGENKLTVIFDSKNLTSFKSDLAGWSYTGILLSKAEKQPFKIEFSKL